jgi:hypothetical protein
MPLIVGAPLMLLLFAASSLPWLMVFRARFGHLVAVPATIGGGVLLGFATLVVSHLLHADYVVATIAVAIVMGVVGFLVARRTPNVWRRPSRYAVVLWCPALLGGLVWMLTVGISQFLPGASRFGWAMNGDSLNNLYYAGAITTDNGIAFSATKNPVPLPADLIAIALGAGSPASASGGAALEHELSAFTLVWVLLLVLTCLGLGVVLASLVSPTLTSAVATVSALGSLLPLTWLVSGLTIQWGYFNVNVLLPLLIGAWLCYLGSARNPVAALCSLLGLSILMLAVWTPLVLPIAALGVTIVVRHFSSFRVLRGWRLVAPLALLAAALAFIAVATIPTLVSQSDALAASGSGFLGFPNLWWPVPIVLVLCALTVLAIRRATSLPVVSGLVALVLGAAVATGLLLFLARANSDIFSAYYPKKLAWILLIVLGAILLSFVFGALAGRVRISLLAMLAAVALFAAVILPPGTWPELLQRQPVVRIPADFVRHGGESTVDDILRFTSREHSTILWQTGNPDQPIINEWLLLGHGGLAHGNKKLITIIGDQYFLYRGSGRYSDSEIGSLCKTLPLLHDPVVITANRSLATELKSSCPEAPAKIVINTTLGGPRPARTGQNWQTDGIQGPPS